MSCLKYIEPVLHLPRLALAILQNCSISRAKLLKCSCRDFGLILGRICLFVHLYLHNVYVQKNKQANGMQGIYGVGVPKLSFNTTLGFFWNAVSFVSTRALADSFHRFCNYWQLAIFPVQSGCHVCHTNKYALQPCK